MWMVRKLEDGKFVVPHLSGPIQGEELIGLQKILASEAGNQDVVLDLRTVKLVDQEAVTFLACHLSRLSLAKSSRAILCAGRNQFCFRDR
jgi:ABC-type transporter Mla MlaB component